MYEYLIDEIAWSGFVRAPQTDYRETLAKRAGQGWRLVQVLPIWNQAGGLPAAYHLIFERPTKGPRDQTSTDGPDQIGDDRSWPLR